MASFEEQAQSLVATSAEIASLRGSVDEAQVLSSAKARLIQTGYDNWDGGIEIYSLMIEIPLRTYAVFEDRRASIERSILDRIRQLIRGYVGVSISEVVVSPVLVDRVRPPTSGDMSDQILAPDEHTESIPSYWQTGHFRLFISHASEKRESAHRLKEALSNYQIAAFVAHDDIEPTKEWQAEIETALRTMDALLAVISEDFLPSKWCDQEVGIAIGRRKLVVPLRVGCDPHGFLGKYQGLQTKGSTASVLALQVFKILLKHELTAARLVDSLVDRLVTATTWALSKATMKLLVQVPRLSEIQAARLLKAIEENNQVGGAIGVPENIRSLISRHGADSAA